MSATRMQHYAIYLQSFDYNIIYRNTKLHGNADCMSRLPTNEIYNDTEETDILELNLIETLPVTVEELEKATKADKSLKSLIEGLKNGRDLEAAHRFNIEQTEFTMQQGCILRGVRVYIPKVLRGKILEELHSTHFGVSRMKSLARGYCWWENIDKDIYELARNCTSCQEYKANPAKVQLHTWEKSTLPFQRVHMDFAGPFMGLYLLIVVDSFSKWPEVKILKNITTENTIRHLRDIFAVFGIPSIIVSDCGAQFTSNEFQHFLQMNGIKHKTGAPYHPSTNGQAESFVKTIKAKLRALKCTKHTMNAELANILLTYRKTIHPETGKSPSMIIFNRQIRSRIDLIVPSNSNKVERERATQITIREFQVGDRVSAREYLDKDVKWRFGMVVEKLGKLHYKILLDDSRIWKRHIDQIRAIGNKVAVDRNNSNLDMEPTQDIYNHNNDQEYNLPNYDNSNTLMDSSEQAREELIETESTLTAPSLKSDTYTVLDPHSALESAREAATEDPGSKFNRPKRMSKRPQRFNDYVCE